MNRLNGPYGYAKQLEYPGYSSRWWDIFDNASNRVAVCDSMHYAQQVAAALTDAWRREVAAIEVAERVERE